MWEKVEGNYKPNLKFLLDQKKIKELTNMLGKNTLVREQAEQLFNFLGDVNAEFAKNDSPEPIQATQSTTIDQWHDSPSELTDVNNQLFGSSASQQSVLSRPPEQSKSEDKEDSPWPSDEPKHDNQKNNQPSLPQSNNPNRVAEQTDDKSGDLGSPTDKIKKNLTLEEQKIPHSTNTGAK